jgi:hypothetical protein
VAAAEHSLPHLDTESRRDAAELLEQPLGVHALNCSLTPFLPAGRLGDLLPGRSDVV